MSARDRLDELAEAAGYGPVALDQLAEALFYQRPAGELSQAQLASLAEAVEVAYLAPLEEVALLNSIEQHRATSEDWRASFWRETLDRANASANAANSATQAA